MASTIDTVVREKQKSFHVKLLEAGFEVAAVVRNPSRIPRLVKLYHMYQEKGYIESFAFVPGEMVPQARKYCHDLQSIGNFPVFYVKRSEVKS
tara:strand:+ start:350 stop:628 length:279 start_codon:yes stop_codon:yes gene_type:complete